jgi:hypothetical protein
LRSPPTRLHRSRAWGAGRLGSGPGPLGGFGRRAMSGVDEEGTPPGMTRREGSDATRPPPGARSSGVPILLLSLGRPARGAARSLGLITFLGPHGQAAGGAAAFRASGFAQLFGKLANDVSHELSAFLPRAHSRPPSTVQVELLANSKLAIENRFVDAPVRVPKRDGRFHDLSHRHLGYFERRAGFLSKRRLRMTHPGSPTRRYRTKGWEFGARVDAAIARSPA